MKNFRNLFLCIFGLSLLAAGSAYAATTQGYVHEVSGDVQAAIGAGKPVAVLKNQELENNTTITTGPNSNIVLKFVDGTVIALNQNTSFQIQKYDYNEKAPSTMTAAFAMLRGGLRAITGAMSARNRDGFKLATPNATIGIRGTEFFAQLVNPLFVQVVAGSVSVSNAAGIATFAAGQTASVASATSLATSIPAVPAGTFGTLPSVPVPPAVPAPVPAGAGAGGAAGSSASGAAAGGITTGAAVGMAAAAAAAAIAISGDSNTPTGTTGTTSAAP